MKVDFNNLSTFLEEGQSPDILEKVLTRAQDLLLADETVYYVIHQEIPLVNWLPRALVLTNKRSLLFKPTHMGFSAEVTIYPWDLVKHVSHKEGLWNGRLHYQLLDQTEFLIKEIPKNQCRRAFHWAQICLKETQLLLEKPPIVATSPTLAMSERLKTLKTWYEQDLIDSNEYQLKKKEILDQL
jgi:hypothetical protein